MAYVLVMSSEQTFHPARRLIVCADDYGLSPGVSLGIRELAERGRITATGAMTCMPAWKVEAPALTVLADRLGSRFEVGLHLTLTDQTPLGEMPVLAPQGKFPGIGSLLKASLARMLPLAEIAEELDRQLDAFKKHFGRMPDFIDGHQHVHLLPGIRQVVLGLFHRRLDAGQCWLRDCGERLPTLLHRGSAVKATVISVLLAHDFAKAAAERGITVNRGFSGFYDPSASSLRERMPALLHHAGDKALLMIHPGHVDAALEAVDTLTTPRQSEWDYLSSDAWPALLAERGITLAPKGTPFSH